jgi:hypothetical protein
VGPGASVRILDGAGAVAGEYGPARGRSGRFWAPAVPGDAATVELRADGGRAGTGIVIDRYGYGTAGVSLRAACGGDDLEDVACYADTPIGTASRAVGRMLFEEDGFFVACTGFLVSSRDHFLTSAHCFASAASLDSLEVAFGHQRAACGGGATLEPDRVGAERLLALNRKVDVALLTLAGRPSARHGFLALSSRAAALGEALYVPQHPRGDVKQVSVHGCQVTAETLDGAAPGSDFGHRCDTEPGSSGSPVLDAGDQVVGVHRVGGCGTPGGQNQALLVRRALGVIPAQQTTFAVERGRLDSGADGTGRVNLTGALRLGLESDGIAPRSEPVTVTLADADGPFYAVTIEPEWFRPGRSSTVTFLDPKGTIANGVTLLRIKPRGEGTFAVVLNARRVPLAGADRAEITATVQVGAEAGSGAATWRRRARSWLYP